MALVAAPNGPIDGDAVGTMAENFRAAYQRVNGLAFAGLPVEGVTFRVQLVLPAARLVHPRLPAASDAPVPSGELVLEHLFAAPTAAHEYERASLGAGHEIVGPAVIREPVSTTFVPPGRTAVVGDHGEIVIT
jgi:N-methylhydantoinase A